MHFYFQCTQILNIINLKYALIGSSIFNKWGDGWLFYNGCF
uniref:Uncharacterized protein n=1 Tax=Rhizophora mucronata TaxID=61149 RepID=A0A2P2QN47_RHIMU